ncbi:hypothetical protein Sango_2505500 [Sesamum angolense]|uniref:Uncharacterized protein n=1 Tax=Sesamum angolense TaxID=2727404 RepID=A0AAE1W496_9LAMI|nr:hypothetical protein Sango_2505500 [Sesamum angolense]
MFISKYYNWTSHGEESVHDYFEALIVPPVSEERIPTGHVEGNYPQWDDEQHMDWAQRMIFDAARSSYFASSHEGAPNDGTRSCPVDACPSSYCYGGDPYDYDEPGLADNFYNADDHIFEQIYDRIFQWANIILPPNRTLSGEYYNTKKLVKDLSLSVEKIDACKNGCMLHWKDDVDLEYYKFCEGARYKPSRGRDPHRKKSPYAVLRYLPLTPRLQRLYSSTATAYHMTWHVTHQTEEGSMCHPSDAEAWKYFDRMYPDFVEEPHNVRLGLRTDGFAPHGVRTYDHATDNIFIMHAALMWTVNDLPAYGMASGWSTTGVLSPICEDEDENSGEDDETDDDEYEAT